MSATCPVPFVLLDPSDVGHTSAAVVTHAVRLEPDGVGEQQCLIDLDGNASIIEVIHFEVGRCATTRVVSASSPVPTRTSFDVQPIDVGCVITLASEMDLPAG